MIEVNDASRRQTTKRRDARSVAAAGTKLQGNAADIHDGSQSDKTAGVKADRNRRHENACCVRGKQGHKQWDSPQSQQSKTGKGVHGQSHDQAPKQQQQQKKQVKQPAQHTRSEATGTAPASVTPKAGASGCKTALNVMVTETEPAAPAASTQNDDDYVYIRVPRERVA